MAKKQPKSVTMRVRVGDNELEVTGPTAFVEKKISDFLENQKDLPVRGVVGASPREAKVPSGRVSSAKKLSVAQFFKQVAPRTDVDRTLAAGYYLETFQGEENFTAGEVRNAIQKAKIPPPKNPNETIAKNIKKGLMMSAGDKEGKMAFVLTTDGEETIKDLLNG